MIMNEKEWDIMHKYIRMFLQRRTEGGRDIYIGHLLFPPPPNN
jgi:hypothetical protein